MSIAFTSTSCMACAVSLLCLRELAVGVAYTKAAAGAKGFLQIHTHTNAGAARDACSPTRVSAWIYWKTRASERTSSMQCTHNNKNAWIHCSLYTLALKQTHAAAAAPFFSNAYIQTRSAPRVYFSVCRTRVLCSLYLLRADKLTQICPCLHINAPSSSRWVNALQLQQCAYSLCFAYC